MLKSPRNLTTYKKKEIEHLFSTAKCIKKNAAFTILSTKATLSYGRVLLVISKKYGNAPERNLLKRRIKSIFWEHKLYEKNIDCAVIARSAAKLYDFNKLTQFFMDIFSVY